MPTCFMAGSRSIGGNDVATASFAPLAFNDSRYSRAYGLASTTVAYMTRAIWSHSSINASGVSDRPNRAMVYSAIWRNCMAATFCM